MKNLLFSFLLIVPLFSIAQESNSKDWNLVFEYSFQNKSSFSNKALFQDSILLVNGCINQAGCAYHALSSYNLRGEPQWSTLGGNFVLTDDEHIYVGGLHKNDDTPDGPLFIKKYNQRGDTVFTQSSWNFGFGSENWRYDYKLVDMELIEDGTILIASNYSMIKSDIEGAEFDEELFAFPSEVIGIAAFNANDYLIHTEDKLYRIDKELTLLDSIDLTGFLKESMVIEDTLYTLFSNYLIRIDQDLKIIDTLFSSSNELYEGMNFFEGTLWLHAKENTKSILIATQGNEMLDTKSFELSLENTDFTIVKNNFLFLGDSYSEQIGIYNFNEPADNTTHQDIPDIAIVDFEARFLEDYDPSWNKDPFPLGAYFEANITVENQGEQAIDSFFLYAPLGTYINCATNYVYSIEKVSILPGESTIINYERLLDLGGGVGSRICMEVLAPNAEIEANISNNTMCTQLVTSISDHKKLEANIQVFPNPASDQLRIEYPNTKLDEIQLLDMAGKLIGTFEPKPKRSSISLAALPKGLYFLKLISKDRYMTRKVMKE